MFGKEYASHLDILLQSFGEINEKYKKKIGKDNFLIEKLKMFYVSLFGIPEIGLQLRSMYFKQTLASNFLNEALTKILDAGCGIGVYTLLLGKAYPQAQVTGGDIDKYKLQSGKTIANELNIGNVIFKYLNITKINSNIKHDLIVCIDVLEHIRNYESALKNLCKLLKSEGYLYIHVPQPNQKRIFNSFKKWYHEDHVREGIAKTDLENSLQKLGFKIIISKDTFGFFGKLAWEINHLTLSKSFFIASITYPLLYVIAKIDIWQKNKNGLGIAVLAKRE